MSNEQKGFAQLDAALKAARSSAIINYGDPALAGLAGFQLDPQAAALAGQNTTSGHSTVARLNQAFTDARKAIIDRLAGRGILFSGETGYQQGQAATTHGNQMYDAQQAVLNALTGLNQQDLQSRMSLQQQLVQAMNDAYNRYVQMLMAGQGGGGGGGGGSAPAPAPTPRYGNPAGMPLLQALQGASQGYLNRAAGMI